MLKTEKKQGRMIKCISNKLLLNRYKNLQNEPRISIWYYMKSVVKSKITESGGTRDEETEIFLKNQFASQN